MAVQALPIASATTRERCCRTTCEYNTERVRYHLSRLLAYQRAGEEPGRMFTTPLMERFGGAPGDGETASLDIRRVVDQLRADRQPITAEAVALALCPWSSEP